MDTRSHTQYLLSRLNYTAHLPFLKKLMKIYAAMDQKYQEAADYYGFHCKGCKDNCCFTRFYHHTLLEYLFMKKGYHALGHKGQIRIKQSALEVCRKTDEADEKGVPVRLMCPLNRNGLCLLYAYRPMTCRLHGIPHQVQRPGQSVLNAPGCDIFTEQCQEKEHFQFDRTPFYIEMAELERALKQAVGITHKIKMTVAQMIKTFGDG